ncbi:site-specific integrase [Psychroflexus salinarum]|uniref:Site-specific integrase n=1 Tax=Psychroflexus salinarum TaxID=546024 RepID=A0ABW3GKZ2_9FLAO
MKVLFLIKKKKVNKRGELPIMCRITIEKSRKEFSTGIMVQPEWWNNKSQEVTQAVSNSNVINSRLNQIRQKLDKIHLLLEVEAKDYAVGDIINVFKGEKTKKEYTLLGVVKEHNNYYEKLVGKELKKVSWQKFENTCEHLKKYVWWKYKQQDIKIEGLKFPFITDFEYYLKVVESMQQSTINKTTQRFKKMINFAVAREYIQSNPFMLHKPKSVRKEIIYLTSVELEDLENKDLNLARLEEIRDCFVFCCYTGLAFKEMNNLTADNLQTTSTGDLVIQIIRQKTGRTVYIPLLPKAKKIIEKYNSGSSNTFSGKLLPSKTNAHFNAYLKEIAVVCKIKKRLTHHIARKTFATTVLLLNDVPIEIVSKLLGHSRIGITQAHYGEILNKKVDQEISRISKLF